MPGVLVRWTAVEPWDREAVDILDLRNRKLGIFYAGFDTAGDILQSSSLCCQNGITNILGLFEVFL